MTKGVHEALLLMTEGSKWRMCDNSCCLCVVCVLLTPRAHWPIPSDCCRRVLPSELAFGERGFHPYIKSGDAVVFELHLLKLLEHGLLRNISASNVSKTDRDEFLRPA